jgi:uncharacterized protein YidB (DUF937 family)
MARIRTKTKNRAGKPKKCGVCGREIQAKEKYYTWTNRMTVGKTYRGITKIRCADHKPKPSDAMTGRSADFARLEESLSDAIDGFRSDENFDLSAFYSGIDGVISDVDSLKDEIEQGRESMPEHLQETGTGEQMGEWIDALENFSSALEDAKNEDDESALDDDEFESEIDDDEIRSDLTTEAESDINDEDFEDEGDRDDEIERLVNERFDERRQEKLDELKDNKRDEIAGRFEDLSLEI